MSSLSYTELKPVKVIDPRVNISEAKNYLFKQGANVVTHRTFTATSVSNSSTTFKANPPNSDIVVSRLVYLTVRFQAKYKLRQIRVANGVAAFEDVDYNDAVTYIAGDGDGNSAICLRQFPLASCMRSLKVNMNSDTLTVQPYHYINQLARYNLTPDIRDTMMSGSPAQPDAYQRYNDRGLQQEYNVTLTAAPAPIGTPGQNLGSIRSPFQSYGETNGEIPRGSYTVDSIAPDANDANLVVVTYTVTEPLFISPLSPGQSDLMGFSQLSTMDVDISWDSGKLARLFSIDIAAINNGTGDGNNGVIPEPNAQPAVQAVNGLVNFSRVISQFDVDLSFDGTSGSELSFIYLTPQVNRPKPESLIYSYNNLYVYHTNIGQILAGAENSTVQSTNMSLSSIPNKVYIYSKIRDQDRSEYTTDNCARLKRIDINFNGVSGILSSAREHELWRMSVDNGLQISYPQWRNTTGSVMCIDFGKNMGLGPQQAVGLLGTFDLSFNATFQNISGKDLNFDLYVIVDSVGTFTLSNGQTIKQLGILSSNSVLQAEDFQEMDAQYLERLYGGNFMTGLKTVYSKAQKLKPYAKKASKISRKLADPVGEFAPRVGNVMKTASDIADSLLGQGYSRADIKKLKAMGYSKEDLSRLAGGNIVGGKGMPKSKLAQRMATYQ